MSIQTGEGLVQLDSSDWQRTINGIKVGLKIRDLPAWAIVAWICEQQGGVWTQMQALDTSMTEAEITAIGGVDGWIAQAVVDFNAWLDRRFPGNTQHATTKLSTPTPGTLIEQIDKALPGSVILGAPEPIVIQSAKIAVLGDSLSSMNNGATGESWPLYLDRKIRDLGVDKFPVRNYSIPGLTWKTAHVETPGFLIGGQLSPLNAIKINGCDILLICLGVNDRNNPNALADAMAFQAAITTGLPVGRVIWVRQNMFDGENINDCVVTAEEQAVMDAVYTALGGEGLAINLRFLFDEGYGFDRLHLTNTGKQWIASAVYMYLQAFLPITPISRNIGWLHLQTQEVKAQMGMANT